ncbi:hypothetical protein G6659_06120 [Polynucleobacter paneuropaeus]|nr:hypothetical protein G6659_06120 [Polynucleobacter paneuropaeus]
MNQLVQKCECCEDKFSQIGIEAINARHIKKLGTKIANSLKKYDLAGTASLAVVDDIVIGLNYTYANADEIAHAENIVEIISGESSAIIDKILRKHSFMEMYLIN